MSRISLFGIPDGSVAVSKLVQPFGDGITEGLSWGPTAGGTADGNLFRPTIQSRLRWQGDTTHDAYMEVRSQTTVGGFGILKQDASATAYRMIRSTNDFVIQDVANSRNLLWNQTTGEWQFDWQGQTGKPVIDLSPAAAWDANSEVKTMQRLTAATSNGFTGGVQTRIGPPSGSNDPQYDGAVDGTTTTFWLNHNHVWTISNCLGSFNQTIYTMNMNPVNSSDEAGGTYTYYEGSHHAGTNTLNTIGGLHEIMEYLLANVSGKVGRSNGINLRLQEENALTAYTNAKVGPTASNATYGGMHGYMAISEGSKNVGVAHYTGGTGGDGARASGFEQYQILRARTGTGVLWQIDGDGVLQRISNAINGTIGALPGLGANLARGGYIQLNIAGTANVKIPVFS